MYLFNGCWAIPTPDSTRLNTGMVLRTLPARSGISQARPMHPGAGIIRGSFSPTLKRCQVFSLCQLRTVQVPSVSPEVAAVYLQQCRYPLWLFSSRQSTIAGWGALRDRCASFASSTSISEADNSNRPAWTAVQRLFRVIWDTPPWRSRQKESSFMQRRLRRRPAVHDSQQVYWIPSLRPQAGFQQSIVQPLARPLGLHQGFVVAKQSPWRHAQPRLTVFYQHDGSPSLSPALS